MQSFFSVIHCSFFQRFIIENVFRGPHICLFGLPYWNSVFILSADCISSFYIASSYRYHLFLFTQNKVQPQKWIGAAVILLKCKDFTNCLWVGTVIDVADWACLGGPNAVMDFLFMYFHCFFYHKEPIYMLRMVKTSIVQIFRDLSSHLWSNVHFSAKFIMSVLLLVLFLF